MKRPDVSHVGIAEQGKVHALAGEHELALLYYREAMRRAVEGQLPEVFFRHYLECSLESLELMGCYSDVLAYCSQAIDHYNANPPQHELAKKDLAAILQRQGVVMLKCGDTAGAKTALGEALRWAEQVKMALPMAAAVYNWLTRGWRVEPARVVQEQQRHDYFSVREQTVDRTRAIALPPAMLEQTRVVLSRGKVHV